MRNYFFSTSYHYVASILFFFLLINESFSQVFSKDKEIIRMTQIPNSPEAQAFNKYGDTDVGLYNGTPNIQIPIYKHKGRELDLPINLTYDASGIKVEQQATGIGLGWNFNVGGRVTRIVNGLPDDYVSGQNQWKTMWNSDVRNQILLYLNNNRTFPSEDAAKDYLRFLKRLNENEHDALPDYFNFNAMGLSDMFVISMDSLLPNALNNPRLKIAISKTVATQHAPGSINSWTVTGDDGTVYVFSNDERTRTQHFNDVDVPSLNARVQEYNSSWLLTSVVSPNAKDVYQFFYQDFGLLSETTHNIIATSVVNYTESVNGNNANFTSYPTELGRSDTEIFRQLKSLIEIKHNGNTIVSVDLNDRHDLNSASAIDQINIFSNDGLLKGFKFNQTYFKTDPNLNPTDPSTAYAELRLKLDSIDLLDSNSEVVSNYEFDYIDPYDLPRTNSFAQDYYGYFNGKSNTVLYPKTTHDNVTDGADRRPSSAHVQTGTLNRIKYPTGGYTIFNYESHRSSYTTPAEIEENTIFEGVTSPTLVGGIICECWNHADSECPQGCVGTYQELGAHGPPKILHEVFTIEEADTYEYSIWHTLAAEAEGTLGLTPGQRVIFFRRDDVNYEEGSSFTPDPLTLPEILTDPTFDYPKAEIDWVAFLNTDNDAFNQNVNLIPGYYQITIVNPEEYLTTNFRLGRYISTLGGEGGNSTQVIKAGIRLRKSEDFTQEGTLALRKKYDYSDGTVLSQPSYEYLVTDYAVLEDWTTPSLFIPPMLYRNSYASGTNRPHIGYEKVTEIIEDFTNEGGLFNESTTDNEFFTSSWGTYFAGMYTYFINGKQTASNYSLSYGLGKPKKVVSKGWKDTEIGLAGYSLKYEKEYQYKSPIYFTNRGVYTRVVESRGNTYACPKKNPNANHWYITHLMPRLVPSGDGSASIGEILGGSNNVSQSPEVLEEGGGADGEATSTSLYFYPPIDCVDNNDSDLCTIALSMVDLQIASAYGRAGYLFKESSIEKTNNHVYQDGSSEDLGVKITTDYTYNDHFTGNGTFLLKSMTKSANNRKVVAQEFLYPTDFETEFSALKANNIVTTPVQVNTYEGEDNDLELIYRNKTEYDNGILPKRIKTAKGNNELEERLSFDRYEDSNLVEVSQENGTSTAYIWGYNKQYVVAKIENATYDQVEVVLGTGFIINQNLSETQENQLRTVLLDAMITTYTYNPPIGVTSITDPTGNTIYYEYDQSNRLKFVKDKDGHLLSKNEYNYRTQN